MKKYIFLSIQQQMPGITFTKVFYNFSTTILDRIIFFAVKYSAKLSEQEHV